MSNVSVMGKVVDAVLSKPPLDEIFGSLPPLGSAEYLHHVQTASTRDLPPEVLARAYRALATSGETEASRATLSRLLGEKNGQPEYLRSMLVLATHRVPPNQHYQEALDLYQDALALILEVLPSEQGGFAEKAWASFCRQRLTDAWRRRQGRRGERIDPKRAEPTTNSEGDEGSDPLDQHLEAPWHVALEPDKLAWLEEFLRRTLAKIPDSFIRGVAEDQWIRDPPSPISGQLAGREPLTERFGASRFQIYRALSWARARLLADLETQDEMEIDLDAFRDTSKTLRS